MRPENLTPAATATSDAKGRLYVVGTPIGNMEDMTFRAIRTLAEVDQIACEDTRHTQQLLNQYGIQTRTISYHEHNELTRAPELIIELEKGSNIALVSDAGMPVVSDPGHRLVKLAIRHDIQVIPVPGASALIAALVASGMPLEKFHFLGFLPSKKLKRKKALEELALDGRTLVCYEAPHRLVEMLEDVRKLLGDRPVVVAREVTKLHEEFVRGSVSEVLDRLSRRPVKGEITVLVGTPEAAAQEASANPSADPIGKELKRVMTNQKLDERAALKVVARSRGISKSEAYRQWQSERGAGERG